jgi:catechol 2,3-dioxygenase-like lactoylglutathione lyase family enzyme
MERLINKLLGDYEAGAMTRRELIQSIAMVAAAAPAAAAMRASAGQQPAAKPAPPIPAAFEPTGWKTVWLDHISFAVSDYRKSAAFYRDLMGWRIANDNGSTQATLDINGIGGIIIRNRREPSVQAQPSAAAPAAAGGRGGQSTRPPLTGVINHISWGIANWDTEKVKAELERRGLNPRPDMVGDNFKSYHVLDPDGWDLQISNETKG